MPLDFELLDHRSTSMGELTLRRRREPVLDVEVYEVKLGDEFLMSSLFTAAERALATLGLAGIDGDGPLDVLVGGLGLGYTAAEALTDSRIAALHVIEALEPVIGWHQRQLIPDTRQLADDPRCSLVHADFFAVASGDDPFAPNVPMRHHAVLLDIDHSPSHHLHPSHGSFYSRDGLSRFARRLHPGGVFAMWSDGDPDDVFVAILGTVFTSTELHRVTFPNPYTGSESSSTVYVAVL